MKNWLHLQKFIHSNCHEPYISSEEYVTLESIKNQGYGDNLELFAQSWGDYIDDEYTERGWHVNSEIVDIPPKEYLEKKIFEENNKIASATNELKLLNKTLKYYSPKKYCEMKESINRYIKEQKVKTHCVCGYPELTVKSFELSDGIWIYKFHENSTLELTEGSLYI